MGIREKLLAERMVLHGNGVPREGVTAPSQSVFKKHFEIYIYIWFNF